MKPSERIKYIRIISEKLSKESWPTIDLTLKQFGLPRADSWNGDDRESYIIQMVGDASPEQILELAEHLELLRTSVLGNQQANCWQQDCLRVFLSHLSKYRQYTAELQEPLFSYGISAFVAHVDIEPTREWQDEIELALQTCDSLVALLTPEFHSSYWTDQEVGYCRGRGTFIIPVKLGLDPYGFIGRYQALNGIERKPHELAESIFEVLKENDQTKEKIAHAVVTKFINSGTFAKAKFNMSLLERLPFLEAHQLEKIELACRENDQVSGSYYVPGRAHKLIEKFLRISAIVNGDSG